MNSPYRQASNGNTSSLKLEKKDVGRITADVYYKDINDKVVSRQIIFTGSRNKHPYKIDHESDCPSFYYTIQTAKDKLDSFLYMPAAQQHIYKFDDYLIINMDRMIEIRLKVEEYIIEYEP